jgi:small multidrug resistance family-3 protein
MAFACSSRSSHLRANAAASTLIAARFFNRPFFPMKTLLLYVVTALAEILGCYLPWRWLKDGGSAWLLVPGALSLAVFAWLLTFHGAAAGRVYAAYGGVYVAVAILWLWVVEQMRPTVWDFAGAALTLAGMSVIAFQPRI